MKVKDLIKVLKKVENQDTEILMYNGDCENSFQNVDFINIISGESHETVIINDQYNSMRFAKEGKIIPLTDVTLTNNNIVEVVVAEDDTKVIRLQGLNPLDLGFLEKGEVLEIRIIDNYSICVVNKNTDNSLCESKYAYCIFNQDSINFIKSLIEG